MVGCRRKLLAFLTLIFSLGVAVRMGLLVYLGRDGESAAASNLLALLQRPVMVHLRSAANVNFKHRARVKASSDSTRVPFQVFPKRLFFADEQIRAKLCADSTAAYIQLDNVYGRTYWLPRGAQPRCALEQLVGEVYDWHVKRLGLETVSDLEHAGAEWWTVALDGEEDDVGWHWDNDYGARERGQLRHPYLATVTYLDAGGGNAPTAVVENCTEETVNANGGAIHKFHLSLPCPGKHICFDGRLLHSAPLELADMFRSFCSSQRAPTGFARVTLLVNLWIDHGPSAAKMLNSELASRLIPALFESPLASGTDQASDPQEILVKQGCQVEEMAWEFGEDDERSITLPIPCNALVTHDCLTIRYEDGWSGIVE